MQTQLDIYDYGTFLACGVIRAGLHHDMQGASLNHTPSTDPAGDECRPNRSRPAAPHPSKNPVKSSAIFIVAAVLLFCNLQIRPRLRDQLFQRNVAEHVGVLSKHIPSDTFTQ